jgi:uncharacterized protein (TIGR03067 family)
VTPLLLAAALTISAPRPKDKADADLLLGRWAATSLSIDGTDSPQWAGLEYEFLTGGRWLIHRDGKELAGGPRTYTTDSHAKPATIDLTEGPAGRPYLGVYKVEGNTLSLSFHTGQGARPADLNPAPGCMTFVFTRVKDKK